jgi:conjugative relaxase-like TrwC/TraI family protein
MLVMSRGALSAAQAARYYAEKYSADDYYSEGRQVAGHWFGRGAQALGLAGAVNHEDFRAVLDGRDPRDGRVLVPSATHGGARRAGWDATFNAPKSVSIQALAGGDAQLTDAHRRAVNRALAELEEFALSRRRGGREWVLTSNIVAARFEHVAARPPRDPDQGPGPDPHLHTHVVIANLTRRPDQAWRALDPLEIYRAQAFVTAVYRSELAREVQRLGYEIRITAPDGRWELQGYEPQQLRTFSRRRREIEAALERLELKGAAAAQNLAHQTRGPKQHWDLEQLATQWRARAAACGIKFEQLLCEARGREPGGRYLPEHSAAALCFSVDHHTEREAVVDRRQLEAGALRYGMGRVDLDRVRGAMQRWQHDGRLIATTVEVSSPRGAYTTREMVELERENLRMARTGIGRAAGVAGAATVRGWAAQHSFSPEQAEAVELTLTSPDWITCLEGYAGSAKTTTVGAIAELSAGEGYAVHGFAPTTRAVKALAEAGLEARTVASLIENPPAPAGARQLWLIDESSLLGTRQVNRVLRHARDLEAARIVFVGDQRQHHAIEAGRPLQQIQRAGIAIARLETIRRQRRAELREVVRHAAAGDVQRAVARLDELGRIREIGDRDERHRAIAREYVAAHEAGERVLVVSPANSERMLLNRMVHRMLVEHGQVAASESQQAILVSRDLTRAQRTRAVFYERGNWVWFTRGSRALGLSRHSYARVEAVDARHDRIAVRTEGGERIDYDPKRLSGVQLYREERRAFAVGDRVQFRAPNRELGVANGEFARITRLDEQGAELSLERGAHLRVTRAALRHLDHGYASTSHSSVGATVDRVIVSIDTTNWPMLVNRKQFYVSISRGRDQLTLYTDSRAQLPGALRRGQEKSIALDRLPAPVLTPGRDARVQSPRRGFAR